MASYALSCSALLKNQINLPWLGAGVSNYTQRWHVPVASAFPLVQP